VRPSDDRVDILDPAGLEYHVADRDEECALVDRLDDRLLVRADDDLGPSRALRLLEIAHRREVLLLVDDAVSARREAEAREDDCLRNRHVLVHDGRAWRRADQTADLVADGQGHLPPPLAPRASATFVPASGVLGEATLGLGRHWAQRVADQVRGLVEDRKSLAVVDQFHGLSHH
jgi:hypothetical protein